MTGTQNFSKKPSPERLHLNFARMKKNGITFEVVIDPDAAIAFKHGMGDDWKEVVRAERVFANAQKGLFSPEHDWKSAFPDMTEDQVIEYIIRNGELQLSSEYRKKLQEFKKNKIIEIIIAVMTVTFSGGGERVFSRRRVVRGVAILPIAVSDLINHPSRLVF